jgi:peptidoglycan/xylan/chitin deacetylase (PgdA/CDA1 family)
MKSYRHLQCSNRLLVTFVGDAYLELKEPGIIVLLYHRITNNAEEKSKYDLDVQKFERHLDLLRRRSFQTVLPREIYQENNFHSEDKLVILSFDDGTQDHYRFVFQKLKKYRMKGVFFVVTKYINSESNLTDNQIKEMSHNQMEIGSHSYSHPYLNKLTPNDLDYELEKSKKDLENILGSEVISFAPPGGWFNQQVLSAAKKAGYRAFFSCEIGRTNLESKPFIFKRIEVLNGMSDEEFMDLLNPQNALKYKIKQKIKFILHDLFGIEVYKTIGTYLKLFSPQSEVNK